ncbi:hypothetical protein KP509_14G064700 [Ceratopteris richardii]|uniref:ACT domain-containing protein n=1 Tax=Ceratopteris richardii TaxID=49495 RepID=A0A8T2T8S1_CERRI|nr:hypothetical protein KP509_14G064700 [Ceratopteris richardii]
MRPLTAVLTAAGGRASYTLDGVPHMQEKPIGDLNDGLKQLGADRPGLLSEIFAVLTNHNCNIVAAEAWTHNTRAASVVYVTDHDTLGPINDNKKLTVMKEQLQNVLRGAEDSRGVKTNFSLGLTHKDRRLNQIMFADRDYEGFSDCSVDSKLNISIANYVEKGYSVVNIRCLDHPKLLYDIVCTITDMQYVVSHGTIDSDGPFANQEYYIRHMDECTLDTEGEKQRVIKCLEAAIKRRSPQGIRLQLCTTDRVGLLSEITRVFRQNGLSIANAGVTTQGENAVNSFYVTNMSGGPMDMRIIEAVRNEIGKQILSVKDGAPIDASSGKRLRGIDVNMNSMPDVGMTLVVVALFADGVRAMMLLTGESRRQKEWLPYAQNCRSWVLM